MPRAVIAAPHEASPKSDYTELGVITSYVLDTQKKSQRKRVGRVSSR